MSRKLGSGWKQTHHEVLTLAIGYILMITKIEV